MSRSAASKLMCLQRARMIAFLSLAVVVAGLMGVLVEVKPAHADTFTVNSTNDREDEDVGADGCDTGVLVPGGGIGLESECTLRAAIQEANANGQSDTISFGSWLSGTITLTLTEIYIADDPPANDLIMQGPGARKITVSGNDADGVFQIENDANVTISGLTISGGNETAGFGGDGGGIYNRGTLTLTNSTVSGNSAAFGGGIYNNFGTLTLTNSTVSGNDALSGGGIYNNGTLTLTNSTVSGNSANSTGGGINNNNSGTLTLTNSTVSGNTVSGETATSTGGGIENESGAVSLRNTIVARNAASTNPDASGAFTSGGNNLIGDISGSSGWIASDLLNLNPLLGRLQDNGGPTDTHALKKGSPAINTIPRATNGCGTQITTDQRGLNRPQGKKCDTGSFEKKKKRRR